MLRRIGWRFFVVALLYALHLAVRGYAIWRVLPRAALPLAEVVRIRFAAEAVEMLTFTGPFLAPLWSARKRRASLAKETSN